MAFTLKQLKSDCKVYGVQAAGAPGMCKAFAEHRAVTLEKVSTFADGILRVNLPVNCAANTPTESLQLAMMRSQPPF